MWSWGQALPWSCVGFNELQILRSGKKSKNLSEKRHSDKEKSYQLPKEVSSSDLPIRNKVLAKSQFTLSFSIFIMW